ncbi:5004_t:CDS:2, partial [Paraglomus brasilianum]
MFYRLFRFTVAVVFAIAFLSELVHAASPIEETGVQCLACCPILAHRIASEHHSRCASIILNNKSGYNIRLVVSSLEDGRWVTSDDSGDIDIDCSPRTDLANGESEVFSSVTSHFLGGISGYALFIIDDKAFTTFAVKWKAPTIGPNEHYVSGLPTENYHVALQYGFDHTVFQVTVAQVMPPPVPTPDPPVPTPDPPVPTPDPPIPTPDPPVPAPDPPVPAPDTPDSTLSERINSQPKRYLATSMPSYHSSDYSKQQPSRSNY